MAEQLEVVIVDNHSSDESIQYLQNHYRDHDRVRIIESRANLGYGQGNHVGIRSARGEFLLIINPDNELEPSGLAAMIDVLQKDPSIGILAPRLVHQDGTVRDSYRTFPTVSDVLIKRTFLRALFPKRMESYLQHGKDPTAVRDTDWVAGACILMRKALYEDLGGFDRRFFLFFEDTDLCRRCWQAGKKVVYFPRVAATDRKHRLSEGGIFSLLTQKTTRIHLMSGWKYFWKYAFAAAPVKTH